MEVADGGAEAETLHGTQVSPGGVQALVVACFSPARANFLKATP